MFTDRGDYTVEAGRQGTDPMLSMTEPPSAVFATSDQSAPGVLDAARVMRNLIMERAKVLLAGESWISVVTHYKGFDSFGAPTYHKGQSPWFTPWQTPSLNSPTPPYTRRQTALLHAG